MKRIIVILVAVVIVLALSLAFAEAMTKTELSNGITYFELWPSCEQAAGIAAGGAGGPITDVIISNEVTRFETVRYMHGMGSCVNVAAEKAAAPAMLQNGVTYFELK